MTSILKVSTIQNTSGGVPTAADLGLNVTGSVVQHVFSNTVANTSMSGSSYVTAVQLVFTPKYNNSSLFILGTLRWQEAINNYGIKFRIRDITNNVQYQEVTNYSTYADGAVNVIDTETVQTYVPSTSHTTARTYALQGANISGATVSFSPNTFNTTALSIFEIAG
jgi:hypothetical protein